tara:strand:+ start:4128 stop:4802 length:675 start_codon:yes stop_codon:yes gene_type:complete
MATVLEIITCLNQIAADAYDDYSLEEKIGLNREEGHPILDSRLIDGFRVRFSGDKMIVTYQSEMQLREIHPRGQFTNEIERKFGDIVKFLKKQYKNLKQETVSLTEQGDADILVQNMSNIRTWVQATKAYKIGGAGEVEPVKKHSTDSFDKDYQKKFTDYLKHASDKRPSNDKRKKQGYDDREDESLGMRTGAERHKEQSYKDRREDSYGKWGRRNRRNNKINK